MKIYILMYHIHYEGSQITHVSKDLEEILNKGQELAKTEDYRSKKITNWKRVGEGENTCWSGNYEDYSIEVWDV